MLYNSVDMIVDSREKTIALGEKLGRLLDIGSTVVLKGELASGKTTFAKGIGKALNIPQVINSPTFTILEIYHGDKTLYHIDAYRLENNSYDLGFDEYDDGIKVIEWPEYYMSYLPKEYVEVIFEYIDEQRRDISFIAHGDRYNSIVEEMKC